MTLFVAIVFAAVAALGAAIATGVLGRGGAVEDRYAAKLAGIEDHAMSLEEMELSKPFRERFLVPIYNRLVQLLVARTPASRQDNIRRMIKSAGNPGNVSVSTILAAKFIAAMAALGVALLVMIGLLQWTFPWVLAAAAAGFVGWIVPDRWLKQVADRRRHGIEDVIPDTIDLLTICLDAGLSFDASMLRIGDKVEGPLREEFAAMLAEVRYGRPRMDALMAMAARIEVEDMTAFVNAVGQSQKLGVALGDTVRIQAAEIRRRRRQRAEERAAQASLKMLFPMIGCIFPTLFIVLMGPVALILLSRH
ncbi:MAG TPA: type II secretion system F family protein [Candidatus Dormibacteraeota bacterium]|nr:type II secretion system F family protein [Candidatus Dormibacteraeota bacterium]